MDCGPIIASAYGVSNRGGAPAGAVLQKIQQLMYDKAMFAPIWELAFLNGVGPRVAESGLGLIPGHAYSAPYEDLRLTPK